MAEREKRDIGLRAIKSAREDRARSKHGRITGPVWLAAGGAVLVVVLVSWLLSDRSLGKAKEDLLAKQRADVAALGPKWFPLRDKIEAIALDAAREFKGDYVAPDAASWDFRAVPGIYLRMRVADAKDAASLRKQARESVKDAFTSCLLREPNAAQAALAKGEPDASTVPDQPWNLRQAYQATRILTDDWANEVKASTDNLRLRVFEQQYDKAQREEIPMAIDIVTRAQLFLFVLDEDVPEAREISDGGKVTEESLQQVPHPARVHVVNLKTGAEVVRLRRTGDADFVFAGEKAVLDPEVRAAMKRQVNNCALAQQVWAAIRPAKDDKSEAKGDGGAADAGK
jgi:hypothetical protein